MKLLAILGWIGFLGQTAIGTYWWLRALAAEGKQNQIHYRQYVFTVRDDGMLLQRDMGDPNETLYARVKL